MAIVKGKVARCDTFFFEVIEMHERIKALRTDHDMTQEEVAKILKTTKQYYQKYEKGIRPLPTHHVYTLALYYHVSADYILGLPKNLDWPR